MENYQLLTRKCICSACGEVGVVLAERDDVLQEAERRDDQTGITNWWREKADEQGWWLDPTTGNTLGPGCHAPAAFGA